MQRQTNIPAVFLWEHSCRVKGHAQGRRMRLDFDFRRDCSLTTVVVPFRLRSIGDAIAIAEWPTEVAAVLPQIIDLVWRQVVTQPIASVLSGPDRIRSWINGETDGVPQTICEDSFSGAVIIEFQHCRSTLVFFDAHIAT